MVTRFLFIIAGVLPLPALAQSIEDYVPPPMFGVPQVQEVQDNRYPPIPPRRPLKLKAPQSYIDYMRKHRRAPETVQQAPRVMFSEQALIEPSAQDILDQINPQ